MNVYKIIKKNKGNPEFTFSAFGKNTLSVWQKCLERMPILYERMPICYERLPILSLRMPNLLSVNGEIPIFWGTHKIKGAEMRLNN